MFCGRNVHTNTRNALKKQVTFTEKEKGSFSIPLQCAASSYSDMGISVADFFKTSVGSKRQHFLYKSIRLGADFIHHAGSLCLRGFQEMNPESFSG